MFISVVLKIQGKVHDSGQNTEGYKGHVHDPNTWKQTDEYQGLDINPVAELVEERKKAQLKNGLVATAHSGIGFSSRSVTCIQTILDLSESASHIPWSGLSKWRVIDLRLEALYNRNGVLICIYNPRSKRHKDVK